MDLEYIPVVRDRRNPKSIINCVTPKYQQLIEALPDELLELPETELCFKAFGSMTPDENWSRLKINFWREYDTAQKDFGGKIDFKEVARGVCGEKHLAKLFQSHPDNFAYLLSRPIEYATQMDDLHGLAIREMRQILEMKVGFDAESGLPDTKLLQAKIQIFKYVDSKQKGAPIQKIETNSVQKNLNVNVEATPEEISRFKTLEEVDRRLRELEQQAPLALVEAKAIVDVLPVDRSVSHNGGRHIDTIKK